LDYIRREDEEEVWIRKWKG